MHHRVRFITHHSKQVLLVDLSKCSAKEVEGIARAVPDVVTAQPRSSVLILTDFTGASVDEEALRAIKESAVFDKPYIKRSAWVGAEHLTHEYYDDIKSYSGRELPTFKDRQEALTWLTS